MDVCSVSTIRRISSLFWPEFRFAFSIMQVLTASFQCWISHLLTVFHLPMDLGATGGRQAKEAQGMVPYHSINLGHLCDMYYTEII